MKAHGNVEIQYLEQQTFQEVQQKYPGLAGKLRDFCERQTMVPSLLRMSGADRRDAPRFPVSQRVGYTLADAFDAEKSRRYTAQLLDISVSGLCLSARIASQDKARLLLGRRIQVDLNWSGEKTLVTGSIVGVQYLDATNQDYTIHINLAQPINNRIVQRIAERYRAH
jgi:hypothetical protein